MDYLAKSHLDVDSLYHLDISRLIFPKVVDENAVDNNPNRSYFQRRDSKVLPTTGYNIDTEPQCLANREYTYKDTRLVAIIDGFGIKQEVLFELSDRDGLMLKQPEDMFCIEKETNAIARL